MAKNMTYEDYLHALDIESGAEKPYHWSDDLVLTNNQRKEMQERYKEFLEDCAMTCNLDSSYWQQDDWDVLEDIAIDVCRFNINV